MFGVKTLAISVRLDTVKSVAPTHSLLFEHMDNVF